MNHSCVIALFGQIEGNQFCNIYIIVYNENFLFWYHEAPFSDEKRISVKYIFLENFIYKLQSAAQYVWSKRYLEVYLLYLFKSDNGNAGIPFAELAQPEFFHVF